MGATPSHSLSSGIPKAEGVPQLYKDNSRTAKKSHQYSGGLSIDGTAPAPSVTIHHKKHLKLSSLTRIFSSQIKSRICFFTFLKGNLGGVGGMAKKHATWSESNQMIIRPALYIERSSKADAPHLSQRSRTHYALVTCGVVLRGYSSGVLLQIKTSGSSAFRNQTKQIPWEMLFIRLLSLQCCPGVFILG